MHWNIRALKSCSRCTEGDQPSLCHTGGKQRLSKVTDKPQGRSLSFEQCEYLVTNNKISLYLGADHKLFTTRTDLGEFSSWIVTLSGLLAGSLLRVFRAGYSKF